MDAFDQTISEPRPSWKLPALIVAATLVAVALIVVAVWFVRGRQNVSVDAQYLARVESQLDQSLEGCAQEADPAACRQEKVLLAAKATGAASVCERLEGAEFDGCVWDVARSRMDPEACASIQDSMRAASCADGLYAKLALDQDDASLCQKIASAALAEGCAGAVNGPVTSENCVSRGLDASACDVLNAYEAAVDSRDPAQCQTISDDMYKNLCVEAVGSGDLDHDGLPAVSEETYGSSDTSVDSDADGLTDADEINVYGTDPASADTDGDGFMDGSELQNGYNPNGEGTY